MVQIKTADGMKVSESRLKGPEVKEDADIDPRIFLVELDRENNTDDPLEVTVTYTVCDDAETFCHTISQSYEVEFRSDRELGSRPGVFMPGMFARVKDLDLDEEEAFTLVGAGEEDYDEGRILITSPLAQGLVGKKKGEKAEVEVPAGTINFEIVDIRFDDLEEEDE